MERKYTQSEKDKFRDRLGKIVSTKMQTVTIYPLSQFELAFSDLIGLNIPEDKLTDEQRANKKKWQQVRNNILSMGNNNRRSLLKELDLHTVIFDGYQTQFKIVDQDKMEIENYKLLED